MKQQDESRSKQQDENKYDAPTGVAATISPIVARRKRSAAREGGSGDDGAAALAQDASSLPPEGKRPSPSGSHRSPAATGKRRLSMHQVRGVHGVICVCV